MQIVASSIQTSFLALMLPLMVVSGCRPAEPEPGVEPAQDSVVQEPATRETQPTTGNVEVTDIPITTAEPPTPEPTSTQSKPAADVGAGREEDLLYRVVFVEPDDVLNVRSGPGVENSIVGALPPGSTGVRAAGNAVDVDGSRWLAVSSGDVAGWVNRRFLTEQIRGDVFCEESELSQLVGALRTAVAGRDGPLLAGLVDPKGGLRLNRHWWNPTIYVDHEDVIGLFNSSDAIHWGTADGSGEAIDGSFSEVMLPLLEQDLLPASEFGCDEILHGGTAGFVRLPEPYEGIHFVSLYRPPASDGFELDWGTWVAGFERREGNYYLSFLVHYQWEI